MGLLDIFTGNAAKSAARKNTAAIDQNVQAGTTALNQGTQGALGLLGTGNGSNALAQLGFGYDRGRQALIDQQNAQQGFLGRVGEVYDPLIQSGGQALSARDDALGLNGQEGYGRARQAFTSSLGYNAGLDGGLDAVQRSAAARGMLASGNTSADLYRFASDYENQRAGSYLDRLTGASNNLNVGLAGQAGGLTAQGNAAQAFGTQLGSLDQTYGQNLADIYGRGAGLYGAQGQGLAELGNFATQQRVGNNNQLAASQMAASGNVLNFAQNMLSGGNLAALKQVFK